jgi:hypothetical protein
MLLAGNLELDTWCQTQNTGFPGRSDLNLGDKVFITRTEPEIALVLWMVRACPTTRLIKDEPNMVCDTCNKSLDWEPFAVIDLPSEQELQDPEYVPIGSRALCRSCAKRFYNLTPNDAYNVDRLWLCYDGIQQDRFQQLSIS